MKVFTQNKIGKYFKISKKKNYKYKDYFFFNGNFKKKIQHFVPTIFKNLNIWNFFFDFFISGKIQLKNFYLQPTKIFFYEVKNFLNEKGNPQGIFQNFSFLLMNMIHIEKKFMPKKNFIDFQNDISFKMRAILIDWLIDVHVKFKLAVKTIFLTINILDRFLSLKIISRQKLQLLGVTAMLIASKYEEIYAPETRDFVYISDNAITKEDIFKMESLICNCLKFDLCCPSIVAFLTSYLKKLNLKKEIIFLAVYCLELTLNEYSLIKYRYSLIAFSIILNLKNIFKIEEENLNHFMNFHKRETDLKECLNLIKGLLVLGQNRKQKLGAVQRKYCIKKYGEIALSDFHILFK
jgi:hypothetical protein